VQEAIDSDKSGDSLHRLSQEIRSCTTCPLSQGRIQAVPGEGPTNPKIMFIGEAPGFHEDQQGRPFVGAAGQYLQDLLISADLKREDVYIANIIKCRPPNNRDPFPNEIQSCSQYLKRQIQILQPKLIVTLGRFSMAYFFPKESISQIHGKLREWKNLAVVPFYHPAAGLYRDKMRQNIEEDFKQLPRILRGIEQSSSSNQPPEQLSLF